MDLPRLLQGGVHRDHRGLVRHVNPFKLKAADRFYVISPARAHELRGWVGHRRDWKWFFASSGEFSIYVARVDDLAEGRRVTPQSYGLEAGQARLLEVPPGYATAIRALEVPADLLVFSTGEIESAAADMLRFPLDAAPIEDEARDCR